MRVKVLSAGHDVIHLLVDGTPYSYVVGHPQPLTAQDLRMYLDNRMLDAMTTTLSALTGAREHPIKRFFGRFCRRGVAPVVVYMNHVFVDWIRKSAVPLEVQGEACLVLTPAMLEKLEKGDL